MNPFKDKAPINLTCKETNKIIKAGELHLNTCYNVYSKDSLKYKDYQNLPFRGSSWSGEEVHERPYSWIDF